MATKAPTRLKDITCAFCQGTGRDPFGIMSPLSTCCVCGGVGTVAIESPYVQCAFCNGTGVYPHSRLTCTACEGTGATPVDEPNEPCPNCLGLGVDPHSEAEFYCAVCHGAGVVAKAGSRPGGHAVERGHKATAS